MNDYVKSYVGEGKAAKQFAKEYLERRSAHKNASSSGRRARHEDDLLTPAQAVNPDQEDAPQLNAATGGGGGGGKKSGGGGNSKSSGGGGSSNANSNSNQGQGGGGGKRRGKNAKNKNKNSSADASHLLGFNVTAGNRVNAGELDLPH